MSDYLLRLGELPYARSLIKSLGLPIPVPARLRRASGAPAARPLEARSVVFCAGSGAELAPIVAETLTAAGASPVVVGDEEAGKPFLDPGEAWARPALRVAPGEASAELRADGLVFDATGLATPGDLRELYAFYQPWLAQLAAHGRVVVLGRPPEMQPEPAAAATQNALEGFVRSLAKEIGRNGSTAQLVEVAPGAESRVEPVLRFVLGERSAFVTGQVLRVGAQVRAPQTLPSWERPLEGKVALVTGAARGIGEATSRSLAAAGAKVVVLDRPADDGPASRLAQEIDGGVLLADVTDADAPQRIASALRSEYGGVDIVIHNAGITRDKTLRRMSVAHWDLTLEVNLAAIVRITQELIDGGVLRDEGRVICLSSVTGIAGNVGQTNYAASKAGVIGFVESLAASGLAERGIAVSAVAPGFIETRLTAAIPIAIREAARRLSALGQGGQPEDVAEVLCFLSSPGSSGLGGGVLRVCGGAFVGA